MSRGRVRLFGLLGVLLITALVGLVTDLVVSGHLRVESGAGRVTLPPVTPPATPRPALMDVARADIGRVVTVEAMRPDSETLGTGWLLDGRGDFVTNAHVIAGQLGVRLRDRDGNSHFATILGVDTTEDVALLRSGDGFAAAGLVISASGAVSPPQGVVVIASGKATGQAEITLEALSGVGAEVPVEGNPDLQPGTPTTRTYHGMLELTGAKIYQGNSGGPVLDARGEVIGIVTLASKSGSQAYAIPIWRVLGELRGWGGA